MNYTFLNWTESLRTELNQILGLQKKKVKTKTENNQICDR
jgi:hypothetical protein